jgi:hypothetical protein
VCIVSSASVLLGEIFLDAVVITALRKKMIRAASQHWTWAAILKTAIPFLLVALILSLAGAVIQQVRPEAKSIAGISRAQRVKP